MQRTQIVSKACPTCGTVTKFERHVTAMGCGDLIMVIFTVGLWLLIRQVWKPPFRCSVCGSR
jgi:hypothetical protein